MTKTRALDPSCDVATAKATRGGAADWAESVCRHIHLPWRSRGNRVIANTLGWPECAARHAHEAESKIVLERTKPRTRARALSNFGACGRLSIALSAPCQLVNAIISTWACPRLGRRMDTVDLRLTQDCKALAAAASEGVTWLKGAAVQSPTVAQGLANFLTSDHRDRLVSLT